VKLRVTSTSGPPVQAVLSSSYTTATVNFITWNKAYSIFPRQTLVDHKFFPLRPLDNDFGSVLREHSDQGWTTRDILWPELASYQASKLARYRRVGDRHSLMIPLDLDSVQQASIPDFVVEYAQFEVRPQYSRQILGQQNAFRSNASQQARDPHNHFPQIRTEELTLPALRHRYVFAHSSWISYAMERLQRWVWVELYKLDPEKRPEQFANGIPHFSHTSILGEFEVPKTWDYADDQIPVWYLEWERQSADAKAVQHLT